MSALAPAQQVVSKRMNVLRQVVGDRPGGVVGEPDEPLELRKAAFTVCRLIPETISFGPGKSPDRAIVCFGFGYDRMIRRLGERNRCDVVWLVWCLRLQKDRTDPSQVSIVDEDWEELSLALQRLRG